MNFRDKKIVLTGAASGIGKELAVELAKEGAILALLDLQALEKVAELCKQNGATNILSFKVDVTSLAEMQALQQRLHGLWGHVDMVIACAGVGGLNPGSSFSYELDEFIFKVNYWGTVNTLLPFVSGMIQQKSGCLIGISSLAALRGLPGAASYCASKSAQMIFLESLRLDLKLHGIQVSCFHPGFVQTPMAEHSEFQMPFKITAARSAQLIVRAIKSGRRQYYFPFTMGILSRINSIIPNFFYDFLMGKFAGPVAKNPKLLSSLTARDKPNFPLD